MKIVTVIIVALAVFIGLKALGIGIRRLAKIFPDWKIRMNFYAVFEFLIWIAFIFWSVDYLFRNLFFFRYLIMLMILVLGVFFSWYLINDMIAGIVFKVKHNLKSGTYIRTGKYAGEIRSMHLTGIQIRTDDGHLIRIPYARLNQEVILELSHAGSYEEHLVQIWVYNTISRAEAEKQIYETIINSPWSILKENPSVHFIKQDENENVFEAVMYLLDVKYLNFIEIALKKNPAIKNVVPL